MTITKEIEPFEWLCNDSWDCKDLALVIADNDKIEEFNSYVEEYFNGQMPNETELNDFCIFNRKCILESLGIAIENE